MEPDERTIGEKVSDAVAKFGGSWYFIISGVVFIVLWMAMNSIPFFIEMGFDPYPFILLNLCLSLVAAFQAPFILMAQKRCEVKQDLIYRTLFREIKELVEIDLGLEHELVEKNEKLEAELKQMRDEIKDLKRMIRRFKHKE